ncbi:hypothetical protein GIB67_013341 [Kingdonia uniflora]|uniref:Retrotransposon Copia-like N-terminal domain-containing protein n=1 Tax=Kingdonia uniflora TaxID=39325 RepID=A0A7J7LR14_9MAGN|nr:hypothetical protein GIB67_013341 [Kingdonia uniflora]
MEFSERQKELKKELDSLQQDGTKTIPCDLLHETLVKDMLKIPLQILSHLKANVSDFIQDEGMHAASPLRSPLISIKAPTSSFRSYFLISRTMAATPLKYPYPSNLNIANFVSLKLKSTNYLLWETQVLSLMESQDLLGFINGKTTQPEAEINDDNGEKILNPDLLAWVRTDSTVRLNVIIVDDSDDEMPLKGLTSPNLKYMSAKKTERQTISRNIKIGSTPAAAHESSPRHMSKRNIVSNHNQSSEDRFLEGMIRAFVEEMTVQQLEHLREWSKGALESLQNLVDSPYDLSPQKVLLDQYLERVDENLQISKLSAQIVEC